MLLKDNIYLERRFFSIRKLDKWAICADTFNKLTGKMVTLFSFCFVKIILLQSDNYVFGTQNNRFCNILISSWL